MMGKMVEWVLLSVLLLLPQHVLNTSSPRDGSHAQPASVGVRGNILSYDLPNSSGGECNFYIVPSDDGREKAIFQYSTGGVVSREHTSETFPSGTIRVSRQNRQDDHFVVKVNKQADVDLNTYFF